MRTLVIIGAGLAGYTLAREFRKLDQQRPVILVTADAGDFYSKPMLSNAMALKKSPEDLVTTPAAVMAEQLQLELRAHTQVLGLDRDAHRVLLQDGEIEYGQLVLAMGAHPARLKLAGDGAEEVLSINHLEDYTRLRNQLRSGHRIAIIGAGLIGCEFANDLAAAGYDVALIHPHPEPLPQLLPPLAGRLLRDGLRGLKVQWHGGVEAVALHKTDAALELILNNGQVLEVDSVISAIGLQANSSIAHAAGLKTQRGIVVDEYLRSHDPDIYALGDCAAYQGKFMPYVLPIMHGARALAKTLAGEPTPVHFPPMPIVIKTPACPLVVLPAPAGAQLSWEQQHDEVGLKMCAYDASGKLVGFVLTGGHTKERQSLLARLGTGSG